MGCVQRNILLVLSLFPRMEAGSNTSTAALGVVLVGGDEKETQCLGV
jgi:hypothetical protein